MASKRMFSKSIVQSCRFLKMPVSSRELYFQLGMSADDEGIVEAWNVMKLTNATEDDLRVLVSKGYVNILNNEDLIAYLTDWNINNTIRQDRKHPSIYKDLLITFPTCLNDNQMTTTCQTDDNQMTTNCQPTDVKCETEISIDKNSINININKHSHVKDVDDLFESLWSIYPRKKGKSQVSKKAKEELYKIGFDKIKKCIDSYTQEVKGYEERFVMYGSTFFNGRYLDYLEKEPVEEVPQVKNRYADYQ